ncbi:unnamed protein product, partial [Owenia fusiformis]
MHSLKYSIIFISLISFVKLGDFSKCKRCKREVEGNSTEKTLSFLADGDPQGLFATPKVLHKTWKLFGVKSRSEIVKKGKYFVEYLKEFGIDASSLTDEQLYQGQPVDLGDYTFFAFVLKSKLRTVTETMPHRRVKYYKNTYLSEIGFIATTKRPINLTGREFVEYLKEFGIDVSSLTDEQLCQGQPVDLGDYKVFAFILKAKLRTVTETMPHRRVKYYKNTYLVEMGFVAVAKRPIGKWNGTIPIGGGFFTTNYLLPNNECDFIEEPDIIEGRALWPFYIENGFGYFGMDVYSNKYGHGTLKGVEIQSQTFVAAITIRF